MMLRASEGEEYMKNWRDTYAWALVCVLMTVTTGCEDVYLSDDIDLDFNWSPLSGMSDSLHLPYVVGAQVDISANDALDEDADLNFTLESSDASVLRIDSQFNGHASCTAVGAGEAEISVFEDGDEIYSGTVVVREPTRAELYAHGPLIIGYDQEEALQRGPVRLLQGGMGTFLIRYYDGDERLYGNGVLRAESEGAEEQGLTLAEEQTFLFEDREWLQVSASELGTFTVDLYVGEIPVAQGVVEVVDQAEVDSFELVAESERGAHDNESLAILAQAYDSEGDPIYGVEYVWDIDGVDEPGLGDLYRYSYDRDTVENLGANFQDLRVEVIIHASDGYVSSTNDIGCSATPTHPRAPGLATSVAALTLIMLLGHRRRNRPTTSV